LASTVGVEEEVVVVVAAAEVEKVDKGVEAACASPRTRYLSPLTRYRSLLLPPAYPSKVFRLT
jgi:hypothetical protein